MVYNKETILHLPTFLKAILFIGSLHLWFWVAPPASTGDKSLYWYLMVPTMSTLYLHVFIYIPIPLPNHKRKPTYNLPRALSGFSFSSIENSVAYTKSPKIESSINLKRFLLLVGVLENVHLYYWERGRSEGFVLMKNKMNSNWKLDNTIKNQIFTQVYTNLYATQYR